VLSTLLKTGEHVMKLLGTWSFFFNFD